MLPRRLCPLIFIMMQRVFPRWTVVVIPFCSSLFLWVHIVHVVLVILALISRLDLSFSHVKTKSFRLTWQNWHIEALKVNMIWPNTRLITKPSRHHLICFETLKVNGACPLYICMCTLCKKILLTLFPMPLHKIFIRFNLETSSIVVSSPLLFLE